MILTYYVPVDSATGQKLKALADRITEARAAEAAFMRLYGVKAMLPSYFHIIGGLEIAEFENRPAPNLWRPVKSGNVTVKNAYFVNGHTKEGKELKKEISRIPRVRKDELLTLLNLPIGSYKVPTVDIHDEKSFIRYQFDAKWYPGLRGYVLPEDVIEKI
jgi:hypothetical protein